MDKRVTKPLPPLGGRPPLAPRPPRRAKCVHVTVDMAKAEDRTVYVAGIWREGGPWEVLGVFDSPEKADAACTDRLHFYAPFVLNERLSDETEEARGVYPRAGE